MSAKLIDGKGLAAKIEQETVEMLKKLGHRPLLAALLVGDDPASHLYVTLKEKACARVGMNFVKVVLPNEALYEEVHAAMLKLNADPNIDAYIVQLPLPHDLRLRTDELLNEMDPTKDADGFHCANLTALEACNPLIIPGLTATVQRLIAATGTGIADKQIILVGKSDVFYRPLAQLLRAEGAKTALVSPDEPMLADICRTADVLIVAVGRPHVIKGNMIKPGAVVIDIGTTKVDGILYGDVDFSSAKEIASWITPVPGGVGPMTVAMLLRNAVILAEKRRL